MPLMKRIPHSPLRAQAGMALIEVLVLIIAIELALLLIWHITR